MLSSRKTLARRAATALGASLALMTTLVTGTASAHGSVSDPPARQYSCYQRWASNWQSPDMATQDPMCHQAWTTEAGAMWNWNGLFREGVAGNHQAAIPDGQLCSAGLTHNGRYRALDTPGRWHTVNRPSSFRLNLLDQSSHGADYIRVYATKQGFNPTTQRLRWSDLELVGQTGRVPTGTTTTVNVNAPGRTGHHVLYTVWQASHLDQSYYFCSDVNFTS